MSIRPARGNRLDPWVSLGAFLAASIGGAGLWGGALLMLMGPRPIPWSHLETLPRSLQDTYTVGVYVLVLPMLAWFWRRWEGRRWGDLGLDLSARDLLEGLWMGVAGLVVIYGLSASLGWVSFRPPAVWPWAATGLDLVAAALMGVAEEIVFRGMVLRTLLRGRSALAAILGSGALYALAHFARPGLTAAESLLPFLGLWATGSLFGYAAWRRGSIWLSTGMHAVWIFFIAFSSQHDVWDYAPAARAWTGSGYPPSGLLALGVMGLSFVILRGKPSASVRPDAMPPTRGEPHPRGASRSSEGA